MANTVYEQFSSIFMNGLWVSGAQVSESEIIDPGTEQSLGVVSMTSSKNVEDVISSAQKAFGIWKHSSVYERADALIRIARAMEFRVAEAAKVITCETGKILAQSEREWLSAIRQFRWYAAECQRLYGRSYEAPWPNTRFDVFYDPVGVVAALTPWNFPVSLIVRKIAPAIAAGCTIIVRPSEETPGSAMIIFDCIRESGLQPGVANLVVGHVHNTCSPLMLSSIIRKISFTGSTEVGRSILRESSETLKKTTMELGGNAPVVVFDDVDLEGVLDMCVERKHVNAGQFCIAPDRFFIHENIYQKFVKGYVARVKKLVLGHGLEQGVDMGPLKNRKRLAAAEGVIHDALSKGGKLQTGGKRPSSKQKGFFLEPTVITELNESADAFSKENFSPISAIVQFSDIEDLCQRINACDHALAAYIFGRDVAKVMKVVHTTDAGMVGINSFNISTSEVPFGGYKLSGIGREGGSEGILEYCETRYTSSIWV